MTQITHLEAKDVRFPTSRQLDGSDAMNEAPDYSATYVTLTTDADDAHQGHGLTFTIGRGNELCVAAIEALAPRIRGLSLNDITSDMAGFWHDLTGDSQLRWVGPEKGVIHLATAALVNAVCRLSLKFWSKEVVAEEVPPAAPSVPVALLVVVEEVGASPPANCSNVADAAAAEETSLNPTTKWTTVAEEPESRVRRSSCARRSSTRGVVPWSS